VTEVVKSKFVQQLFKGEDAQLLVFTRPLSNFWRQRSQNGHGIATEILELVQFRLAVKFFAEFEQLELVVGWEKRILLVRDGAESADEPPHFDICQVRQHHADGPPLRRRLPIEIVLADTF